MKGIIRKNQVEDFMDAVEKEIYYNGANLYSVFNGYTRMVRGTSFFNLADNTRKLKKIIDEYQEDDIALANPVLYASRLN